MDVEPIGVVTVLIGILTLFLYPRYRVAIILVALLFGAAAGVILTGFGSANIAPSQLLIAGVSGLMLTRRRMLRDGVNGLKIGSVGFWLFLTVFYSLISAYFLPRLFAGATAVITVSRGDGVSELRASPLGPVSGNVTQTLYLFGDLALFMLICSETTCRDGVRLMMKTLIACGAMNILFAVADYVTYFTHTAFLLGFMRNATYRMLDDVEFVGMKRLVGSYPEASTFAYATLGFFAFSAQLFVDGVRPKTTGAIALLSLIALVLSTSTTGYVGTAGTVAVLYAGSCVRTALRRGSAQSRLVTVAFPFLVVLIVLGALMDESLRSSITDLVSQAFLKKAHSDSGLERSMWNAQAWRNVVDTMGFGVGVGSVRASSFLIAVPASIGVVGSILYAIYIMAVLSPSKWSHAEVSDEDEVKVARAAKLACFAQLLTGMIAGTFIDLGLMFTAYAALASAPGRLRRPHGRRLVAMSRPLLADSHYVVGAV